MKISIQNLLKQYEEKTIIDHIDFSDDIHTLAIIGPSGGGKSTLLRMMGGLIPASSGNIFINEQLVPSTEEQLPSFRKNIGYVFQNSGLFSHLSAKENITLPPIKVHHYSQEQANQRADELLKRFGLDEEAHKRPSALSGGQQQRIAIARAIAPRPQILLLDEPTSALDPEYTTEVLDIINELKDEGMDFVIVTHEMGFARHACEKVAFLCDGKILEYGHSDQVFNHPQTPQLQSFLGKLLEWNV